MSTAWDNDEADNLEDVVRFEVVCLWDDLNEAKRHAANGVWSIGCSTTAARILMLSRFVGACPWDYVQVNLILDGTYRKVYDEAGIDYPPIDMDSVRSAADRIRAAGL